MSIHVADALVDIVEQALDEFVNHEVVPMAKLYAPEISGRLVHSIRAEKVNRIRWIVATHAEGDNGFAYPAHIEAGEGVTAHYGKALHFRIRGREIITKSTNPSSRSHFMRNTVNRYK